MTTTLVSIYNNEVSERKNDLRIYATDSVNLNEETTLKIECDYIKDFAGQKFELPTEFYSKKYLHFVNDIQNGFGLYENIEKTQTLILNRVDDKKYFCRESAYDLDEYYLKMQHSDFRSSLANWGKSQNLSIKIIKYIKPAFKSQSKYFPKRNTFISTRLKSKNRTQLADNELSIVNLFFGSGYFDIDWYFRCSKLNEELKLSVQDFDKVIESLLEKGVLEMDSSGVFYLLNVTV